MAPGKHAHRARPRREPEHGDLPPGEYTLRCLSSEAENRLSEIPRVVVRAGETTHDPRCEPIDLRGKIR